MSALEFEPDLFNSEAYARLHADRTGSAALRVEWFRHGQNEPAGVFHAMQLRPGVFASPGRGSYGGFDIASDMNAGELRKFLEVAEERLRTAGAREVQIVLPPFCYSTQREALTLPTLCRAGYRVTRQELNQAIDVGETSFALQGDYANRKRMAKAARAGVVIRELDTDEHKAGYETILENRHKKGRSLSMSWNDLQDMLRLFPERVRVFAAEHEGSKIAAAVCLAVNPQVFYVYAWGERAGAEAISPVSLLAAHLFTFAQQHNFSLLDLGTSSVDGVVNPGLHRFKRSLGATPSLKFWLEKSFA